MSQNQGKIVDIQGKKMDDKALSTMGADAELDDTITASLNPYDVLKDEFEDAENEPEEIETRPSDYETAISGIPNVPKPGYLQNLSKGGKWSDAVESPIDMDPLDDLLADEERRIGSLNTALKLGRTTASEEKPLEEGKDKPGKSHIIKTPDGRQIVTKPDGVQVTIYPPEPIPSSSSHKHADQSSEIIPSNLNTFGKRVSFGKTTITKDKGLMKLDALKTGGFVQSNLSPLNSGEILNTKDFVFDTLNKRLEQVDKVNSELEKVIRDQEQTIADLLDFKTRAETHVDALQRNCESLKQRQQLLEKQLDKVKIQYLDQMENAPKALERAHVALSLMIDQIQSLGGVSLPDNDKLKEELQTSGSEINKSLQDARAVRTNVNQTRKIPHHLRKFMK